LKVLNILTVLALLIMTGCAHKTESPPSQGSYQVSRKQVGEVLLHLEKCAQKSLAPENMFFCSCESDIFLSRLSAPADLTAHCKEVAQYNLQVTKLPKQEQIKMKMRTGAKDIGVGSLNFFGFFAPCIVKAKKTGDPLQMDLCHCLVHDLVDKLVFKEISSDNELVNEFKKAAEGMRDHSGKCYQTAEAKNRTLPGPDPSVKLITGYWSANIASVNGEYAKQIAKKTDTLYWKTFFDPRSKKAHYYRIHDFSVDSTETLEGYPKVLCISDARVEFGKHFQEFVSHSKKNNQESLYYAHLGAWQKPFIDETSFSYSDGTTEINANHIWEDFIYGQDGVWNEKKGTGTIAIWDGLEYQEIILTNVTFSLEDGYADPQTTRKFESKTKPYSSE